jgi:hypothetical protein
VRRLTSTAWAGFSPCAEQFVAQPSLGFLPRAVAVAAGVTTSATSGTRTPADVLFALSKIIP